MDILIINGNPKMGSAMTGGMLMPYNKVLEQTKSRQAAQK